MAGISPSAVGPVGVAGLALKGHGGAAVTGDRGSKRRRSSGLRSGTGATGVTSEAVVGEGADGAEGGERERRKRLVVCLASGQEG